MRLLIIGSLSGQIGAASRIAIQRGAKVLQAEGVAQATLARDAAGEVDGGEAFAFARAGGGDHQQVGKSGFGAWTEGGAQPAPNPAAQAEQAARIQQWGRDVTDCAGLDRVIKGGGAPVAVNDMGEARLGDLAPDLRQVVAQLPVGRLSPPFNGGKQVVALMVCERQDAPGGGPSREAVANALGNERLDMLQRRYMRDLRRAAFVEMRV